MSKNKAACLRSKNPQKNNARFSGHYFLHKQAIGCFFKHAKRIRMLLLKMGKRKRKVQAKLFKRQF